MDVNRYVVAAGDLTEHDGAAIGGKAAGLARLVRMGCRVPEFFVLTTAAWRASGGGELAPEVRAALSNAVGRLGDVPLAVRSSAVVEDGAAASWAGQFDSVLGVRGAAEVERAVLRCWASGGGERARAYAEIHGVETGEMAVVVQVMVPGEASGVLFTRDPDDPDRALVSVGLGLGEGVVQGIVPCDTFRVGGDDAVEVEIADKDEAFGAGGPEPVDDARRTRPALSDDVVRMLVREGRRLEADAGVPQDVEFTVAGGVLHLLQARPITVPVPRGRRLLWDNSNIVESYSGITTPLTYSFASRAYTIVYQLFCRVMGVSDAVVRENEPVFRRMIGLVRGRIYYNLNAWYRVLSLLPGFSFNKEAMETMMGVSEVASDEDAGAPPPPRWREGLALGRLLAGLGWRLFRLESDAARFERHFASVLGRVDAEDLGTKRPDELLALYEEVERELLWAWTPPLVNDFFCMIFYRLLQKRCQELTGDPDTQLHNALLAGEGELASAAPALDLLGLAQYVRTRDALALAIREPDDAALAALRGDDGFRDRWDRWMAAYGDRSPDELKLEAPSLRDTPSFVLGALRGWVRGEVRTFGEAERARRVAAEREAYERLGGVVERAVFRFVVSQARRRVATRERLRFERTRIFGFVRRLFRAFGDRYADAGALDQPADVFFLTVDEVLGYTRGTTATTDLRGLVAVRRAEFAGFEGAEAPAERFHTWGAVHVANRFRGRPSRDAAPDGDALQGTACAPGRAVAEARVVTDPRACPDLGGALLVAHRTDPGWVPLYPTASGILVERGSLLSHSAVVARELGLPAIVGVSGLLGWVRDGEVLGMDGSTGRIWREPVEAPAPVEEAVDA